MPHWIDELLGLHTAPADLDLQQMAWRALVVFIVGVALVRLADRRFLGRNAGFDMLLGIVLGSVLSRAVNGQAAFFPTLGASALLVLFHRLLGAAACRSHLLSQLIKGQALPLVHDGKADTAALRKAHMSDDDLEENLRLNGNVESVEAVREARLERNGSVSVIKGAMPSHRR
jgi:uncharacterized membrane protein YcaP (DUF421 family)